MIPTLEAWRTFQSLKALLASSELAKRHNIDIRITMRVTREDGGINVRTTSGLPYLITPEGELTIGD